ncbi:MAG TPA: hypothetical protein PKY50_17835 [Candidatus Competibacter sp.]|nr:hypothetical protein [Candidatus Competibacter sp.]
MGVTTEDATSTYPQNLWITLARSNIIVSRNEGLQRAAGLGET